MQRVLNRLMQLKDGKKEFKIKKYQNSKNTSTNYEIAIIFSWFKRGSNQFKSDHCKYSVD